MLSFEPAFSLSSFTPRVSLVPAKLAPTDNGRKMVAGSMQMIGLFFFFFFNAILPNLPTLSLSHRVHKTVLYISVSFAVSYTGLLLPSF